MTEVTRRTIVAGMAVAAAAIPATASAQSTQKPPAPQPQANPPAGQPAFGFEDVIKRAREVSAAPYDDTVTPLPEQLTKLDFDAWREIRFRSDRSLLGSTGGRFRLQLFHLGHLFLRPVTINTVRDGVATPIPYTANLFDYGRAKFDKPLPVNLGFAGFRIHFPLNDPRGSDELLSFIGASYFRWLGRGQKYGLSSRGLSIGTGLLDNKEEFPVFREFWIDTPDANTDRLTIYALLDSPSVAGAYKFIFTPGPETPVDVEANLFPRKPIDRVGLAPLTSMFFLGENDRHLNDRNKYDEFRAELHDSDGLQIRTDKDEWIWRPIHNPLVQEVHNFPVTNVKGFGLMQRDRNFAHYQDIELNYEERPSYWIEPKGNWGEGRIELIELATKDETFDNIITAFIPNAPIEAGKQFNFAYRMRSMHDGLELNPLGKVLNTFTAPAYALGSAEAVGHNTRRFMVDFNQGDLAYYLNQPNAVEIVADAVNGKVFRKFLVPNPAIKGFRVMLDLEVSADDTTTMTCYLQAGRRRLTETWAYSWKIYNF
ncbi:MAG: glucan biosynthesis protein G [Rhizobiales bacterium 62-17]|nr:glucan biosynthesis protein G [Hyphomicrobiales bacterium]OJY02074.1 MAG: glucan biosynthesis protein G [Rhizobiales bacterium 62-17]